MQIRDNPRRLPKSLRILAANAAILILLALVPPIARIDLYTGTWMQQLNLQPKLHAYCATHACAVDPALVTTSYALQGSYAIIVSFIASIALSLLPRWKMAMKDKLGLPIVVLGASFLFTFADATGIERGRIFSNYVHLHAIYLLDPALIHMFVTSTILAAFFTEKLKLGKGA